MKPIELLAPARDFASARAAVDAGADAVYIGAPRFGARHAAGNSLNEIADAVQYAQPFGVRVYATLNTLLLDGELDAAREQALALLEVGVSALIIQDMAYVRMGLNAELHASTQTAIRTVEQARFLSEAGFSRIILERGLSLDVIRQIAAAVTSEVECFVHGAICVGYSGRCFLSRSMSDRSGNRGDCAQPCRQTWDLSSGDEVLAKGKHLLSLRDLNLSRRLPELLQAGVRSLKIEGRLKDESYVRNVTAYYNRLLGDAPRTSRGWTATDFEPDPWKTFSRGFTEYFFDGRQRGVASLDTAKAVGRPVSREELHPADGVCWMDSDGLLQGAYAGDLPMGLNAPLYRNFDHRFVQRVKRSRMRRFLEVSASLEVSADRATATFADRCGNSAVVHVDGVFSPARQPQRQLQQEELSRSGDTIFRVAEVQTDGAWFVPVSLLARLRREGLAELSARQPFVEATPFVERPATYPRSVLTADENVTNRLAEQFYRDHGVRAFEAPLELSGTRGAVVMRTPYCIRRELGLCAGDRTPLFFTHGTHRYRADFDCAACEMTLTHV